MKTNNKYNNSWKYIYPFVFIFTLTIVFLYGIYAHELFKIKAPQEMGTFGDQFGVLSCVFSGLAFAAMIIALHLQTKELSAQREEIKKQFLLFEQQQADSEFNTYFNLFRNETETLHSKKYFFCKDFFSFHLNKFEKLNYNPSNRALIKSIHDMRFFVNSWARVYLMLFEYIEQQEDLPENWKVMKFRFLRESLRIEHKRILLVWWYCRGKHDTSSKKGYEIAERENLFTPVISQYERYSKNLEACKAYFDSRP